MDIKEKPVGFFDSGVGGISVLKAAMKLMPEENYVYFGDSKNAPYGIKDVQTIKALTFDAVKFLIKKDVKAIVIACNTATSAAINDIRKLYNYMPVVGIEPAVKPAVELKKSGKIIIMATPVTLKENKFRMLEDKYENKKIISMPCAGLVELIEDGKTSGMEVNEFLRKKFENYKDDEIGVVVLGCTHYPFVKNELRNVLGSAIPIIDGSSGTVKQLKKLLIKFGIKNTSNKTGEIKIFNSLESDKMIDLSYKLLNMKI